MKLTPEDLQKLHTKQVANIIRKLNAGKTLTRAEQETLAQERAAGTEPQPPNEFPNFVRNWDDLAQALGVSRKSLGNWRAREDLRSAPDFPRPRADGRHDVNAWRRFMIAHGLNRADELVGAEEVPEERRNVRDWKEHREKLLCDKLEREIARGDRLLLVATELEVSLGASFVAIQNKLIQFPQRTARFMVMRRDEAEAETTLRDEMDAVIADLNLAGYIDVAIDEIVRQFPFDEETAALYAKFGGQDRDAFVRLIACATRETLRRIGQRAIAKSEQSISSDSRNNESIEPSLAKTATTSTEQNSVAPIHTVSAPQIGSEAATAGPPRKPKTLTPRRKRGATPQAPNP